MTRRNLAQGTGRQRGVPRMWSGVSDDILVPEAALPEQFQDIWHRSRAITPERALALAVLWEAVSDLHKYRFARRRRQQRLYSEAYRWVTSDDASWPYSFINLCDLLGFSPEPVRQRLLGEMVPVRPTQTEEVPEAARAQAA